MPYAILRFENDYNGSDIAPTVEERAAQTVERGMIIAGEVADAYIEDMVEGGDDREDFTVQIDEDLNRIIVLKKTANGRNVDMLSLSLEAISIEE